MCTLQAFDILMLPAYLYLVADTALSWDDYSTCHSPIQLFLIMTFSLLFLHRVFTMLKLFAFMPRKVRKTLSFCIDWIINPGFLYLTVQGMVWQGLNEKYSPKCIPVSRVPLLIWWWIILLIFIDILVVLTFVIKIIKWWKLRSFRRRIGRLVNEILILDEQALNQILLNSSDDGIAIMNEQTGLDEEDIERLPKKTFTQGFLNLLQLHQDSCPICYQEMEQGEEVLVLPGCNHFFHSKCIRDWLTRNPLCPMCRSNVKNNIHLSSSKVNRSVSSIECDI